MIGTSLLLSILATSTLRIVAVFGSRLATPQVIEFLTCVTYGMLGALTLRIVFLPSGELEQVNSVVFLVLPVAALLAHLALKWSILRSLLSVLVLFAVFHQATQ